MGPVEWIVATSALAALVAAIVTYWVLEKERRVLNARLNELERTVHECTLDWAIDRIEREPYGGRTTQASVPPRR